MVELHGGSRIKERHRTLARGISPCLRSILVASPPASAPFQSMAMRRPYPALEHLEVSFCEELQVYPQSTVHQLVAVTDEATAELRRRQERALLFEYARLPSPDELPTG
eukprot:99340-Amphidinium_carterae.1